jgi:acetylornithine deacetylase/succinyl-diaminopimelate desuccinylase-like protein
MSDEITRALDYIEKRYPNLEEELAQLIQIPSVTMDKEACAQAAGWLMRKLERMGMDNIQLFETSSNPVLFAEKQTRDEHKPTVLIYGHYDVQKPDPLDEWDSEPYQLERQGEYLFGRGTSDMKGQLLAMLLAVEALLQDDLLPVNIKVLLEGNEEAPPQVLETFVPENQALLSAVGCVGAR